MSLMELLPKSKMERERLERNKLVMGAAIGVAVGAVAGVLLAPKSGKQTRTEIAKNTQKILGEATEKITEEAKKIMSGAKEQIVDIRDAVVEESRFQKPLEITEEQVVAFKQKLK